MRAITSSNLGSVQMPTWEKIVLDNCRAASWRVGIVVCLDVSPTLKRCVRMRSGESLFCYGVDVG